MYVCLRLDEHLEAAYSLRMRLPPVSGNMVTRQSPGWFFKFKLLLRRNFNSYLRNVGNVVARLTVTLMVGILNGLIYLNLGARESPQILTNIFGEY